MLLFLFLIVVTVYLLVEVDYHEKFLIWVRRTLDKKTFPHLFLLECSCLVFLLSYTNWAVFCILYAAHKLILTALFSIKKLYKLFWFFVYITNMLFNTSSYPVSILSATVSFTFTWFYQEAFAPCMMNLLSIKQAGCSKCRAFCKKQKVPGEEVTGFLFWSL